MNSERSPLIDALVGHVRTGRPHTVGALTLVPLFTEVRLPEYQTLGYALATGELTIGEVGGGHVPELLVSNKGGLPVLMIEGEHLRGG